jgi:hypothetical protein
MAANIFSDEFLLKGAFDHFANFPMDGLDDMPLGDPIISFLESVKPIPREADKFSRSQVVVGNKIRGLLFLDKDARTLRFECSHVMSRLMLDLSASAPLPPRRIKDQDIDNYFTQGNHCRAVYKYNKADHAVHARMYLNVSPSNVHQIRDDGAWNVHVQYLSRAMKWVTDSNKILSEPRKLMITNLRQALMDIVKLSEGGNLMVCRKFPLSLSL